VSKAPKIVDLIEKLNNQEGSNATIFCALGSGDLEGLSYEWFRDDKKVFPSNKIKILTSNDGSDSKLRIIDLKPNDSGSYSCLVRNRFGQDKMATKLSVKGKRSLLFLPHVSTSYRNHSSPI